MPRRIPIIVCVVVTLASVASAQEWTRFRGPNGSGQSETSTIPATWTENDYLWRTKLPGVGHSSPVLWGEKVFLTSADPEKGTRYALCLSAVDGKILWQREYSSHTHPIHVQNSLASSTPTVDAQRVYFAWATPEEVSLIALDHEGHDAWKANLGPFDSKHGFGTSPILYEDLVILGDEQEGESFLIAVESATGKTRWRVPRKIKGEQSTSYATPCIMQSAAGRDELIVASWAHGISSIEPRSGKTIWEAEVLERRPVGSPILVDGLILAHCGEGSGNNNVVALRPGSAGGREAEVVFKLDKTSAPYVPSMVAKGSLVFLWGDRGVVTCIDAKSGKQHWQKRVGGNYSSSPVRVGDCVYCASAEGEVVTLAASDKYELLGRSPMGEGTRSSPAVATGRMFLRSESHLMAVGRK